VLLEVGPRSSLPGATTIQQSIPLQLKVPPSQQRESQPQLLQTFKMCMHNSETLLNELHNRKHCPMHPLVSVLQLRLLKCNRYHEHQVKVLDTWKLTRTIPARVVVKGRHGKEMESNAT
jgi:hypothetical protein